MEIVTDNVALALDRIKTSSRSGTHILAAAAVGLGYELDEVVLSHSTVHRTRENVQRKMAEQLKKNLQLSQQITVHWDGKLLLDLDSRKKVERLPIIVSGSDSEQLLGIPKLDDGSASTTATTIVETIREWNLHERIRAMCFDTTPVNTGKILETKFFLNVFLPKKKYYVYHLKNFFFLRYSRRSVYSFRKTPRYKLAAFSLSASHL